MGRLYAVLDPAGYKYAEEPGFCWRITGAEIFKRYLSQAASGGVAQQEFFCPETQAGEPSEWLMPMPRHWFNARWYAHADLGDYVIRQVRWTLADGITASEFEPTRMPNGTTYAANQWIAIPSIAAGDDAMSVDLTAMFSTAGVSKPTDIRVVAFTDKMPDGTVFGGGGPEDSELCPYWQFVMFPDPAETLCFGFNDLAMIVTRGNAYILRDTGQAHAEWELLGKFALGSESGKIVAPGAALGVMSRLTAVGDTVRAQTLAITVVHGIEHVHVYAGGAHFAALVNPGRTKPQLMDSRPWWVAGYPGGRLAWQCQVVGYEVASYTPPVEAGLITQPMFDLGQAYMPTEIPVSGFGPDGAALYFDTTDSDGDGVEDNPPALAVWNAGWSFTSSLGNGIYFDIVDEAGNSWVSDGTHQKGALVIQVWPSTNTFWPTFLREVLIKFPVKLTDRVSTPLVLSDANYGSWEVSTSLGDAGGKRVRLNLNASGSVLVEATSLALRDGYPIHIEEDTTGDGNPDTVRVRGWVDAPEQTAHRVSPDVYFENIEAAGLLKRMDYPPLYLPQALDPAAGKLECKAAITEAMRQCGFDETAAFVLLLADPFAGTDIARLPGQQIGSGEDGVTANDAWQLGWDETWLQYCADVAQSWRGWVFYETLTEIWYHPELLLEVLLGRNYYIAATIYSSHAAAAAAGAPRQCYTGGLRRTIDPPKANVIRVSGKDASGKDTFHLLDRDTLSVSDPAYEHYLGEWRAKTIMSKYAVSRSAAAVVARILRLRSSLRSLVRTVIVKDLPPWEFIADSGGTMTLAVGDVVTLQGLADFLITNLTARGWKGQGAAGSRNNVETEITGVKLPDSATADNTAGEYPGVG